MITNSIRGRLQKVRGDLKTWNIDGLLVGSAANRRWLSGFSGSAGWLLVTKDKALLATDFRYWIQASKQAPDYELFKVRKKMSDNWEAFLNLADISTVGIEAKHLTIQGYNELEKIGATELIALDESVESHRAVKDGTEINLIRQAASITDKAMGEAANLIQPGASEREIAWKLEQIMRDAGADSAAFPIIVASGPNGAMAHHSPGDRTIEAGDTIIVDMGASYAGYNGDLTRSFYVGDRASEQFYKVYDLVLQAQEAALRGIRAGVTGRQADKLARNVIEGGGFGAEFGHSLGHGIGLEVHEEPRLTSIGEERELPAGAVVTIEPGIYLEGWGGIRTEDLVVVTESGVELLSRSAKDPLIPIR